jgi:hypothetical protein
MEITSILIGVFGTGAGVGIGYLLKSQPEPQKLIAPKGAENLPRATVLILQLNALQDELRDCSDTKRRDYLCGLIAFKVKEIGIAAEKTEADFIQSTLALNDYNLHRLSIGEKMLPITEKERVFLQHVGRMAEDETLELQPLKTVALKKKFNFVRLKAAFLSHKKTQNMLFWVAFFRFRIFNFIEFAKFKLSL